jgi:hypothetical protein
MTAKPSMLSGGAPSPREPKATNAPTDPPDLEAFADDDPSVTVAQAKIGRWIERAGGYRKAEELTAEKGTRIPRSTLNRMFLGTYAEPRLREILTLRSVADVQLDDWDDLDEE